MAVPISKNQLYTEILGIPPHDCPPNHYRLLGLNNFERDPATIEVALNARVQLIKNARHGAAAESFIRHVQEVGNLLLTPHLKEAYDGILLQQTLNPPASVPPAPYGLAQPQPAPAPAQVPFPGQPHAYSAGQQPTPTAPAGSVPRATAPAKQSKPRPKLKRTGIHVPVWVRLVIIGMFVAAHGAIYWYAYDYLNKPVNSPTGELSQTQDPATNSPPVGETANTANEQSVSPAAPPLPPPRPVPKSNQAAETLVLSEQETLSDYSLASSPPPLKGAQKNSMTNRDYNPAGIPRPIEKQPPALPFSQLEPYVSLPELKPETATYEGAIEFGTIAAEVAAEMELSIESAAVNLAGRRFHLVSRPASESDHRAWDVQLAAATEQEPATSKSVGHVWADSAGALKFHWNAEAEQEEAEQLQNTLLLCSHKEHRHAMALRVPDILPEIGMDLSGENGKDLTTIVSLLTPPQADTLRLTIDYPDELAVPVEAEPANRTAPLGEGMMLKLGVEKDVVRGEIRILARQKTDNQIQLSVSPKYRQEGDGKLADLTQEKLVSQISRLQRLLSKDTEELAAAYVNLPTYLANMKKLQGTVPRNKDEAGAKARTLIQLEGYVKKCQSAIRAKTRTMPASYEALHRIIEAAKLGRKLNNKAPLQYCLFAETPSGPIVLVQGNQPVEAEQKEDAFAFLDNTPGPTGTWLKLNPELQIVQFSSGGSISATDASGKRSLASGSWRAEGELIHISYGGTSDDFNFYNGVAIATEDGNAFFRKF